MTRGRRKDLSIPPSRALLQQRDYRARKAQYVADLEERTRKAEEENAKLKREIDSLRMRATASGTIGPSPEVVSASSELMHQLTAAASCLARFQQLTFNEQAQAHAIQQAQMQTQNLQPVPPPPSLPMSEPTRPTLPSVHEAIGMQISQGTSYPPSTASHSSHSQSRQASPPRAVLHPSRHAQPPHHTHAHAQSQPPSSHHHHHPSHSQQQQQQQQHAHSLSPNLPPVHPREFHSHPHSHHHHHGPLRMSPPETPRQTSINGGGPPSSSSSSAAASPATTRILPPPAPSSSSSVVGGMMQVGGPSTGARGRSNSYSYSVYNEVETAWGYFDSRDLGLGAGEEEGEDLEEGEDEDQLFAEDDPGTGGSGRGGVSGGGGGGGSGSRGDGGGSGGGSANGGGGGVGPHRTSPQGIGRGGLPSPREMLIGRSARRRTSDMRSTTSRSSSEDLDEPMRMREDSPMRLR